MSPITSFILASVLLWVLHYIQTLGARNAGILNAIITIAKVIPLLLVIIFGLVMFKTGTFNVANWASKLKVDGSATSMGTQIKGAMSTILWCFIGVEAATVLSTRAKSQKDVGKATVISLLITLTLYILISITAMGTVPAKQLAGAQTPLADVLSGTILANAGGVIVKLGLILSLIGGLVSWIMLAAEIPYVAAKGGTMPKWFAKENKNGAPVNSLLITDILTELFLLSILSPALQTAYNDVYTLATTCILIPYLLSAMYAFKVSAQDKSSAKDYIISILACIYAIFVLYASGIKCIGETLIMYAIGIFVFCAAKKEKNESISNVEKIVMFIIAALAILMLILLISGTISL